MLQYKIEALDREDFKVSSIALEEAAPPKRSVESPSTDNNATSPTSLANISTDPELARLLYKASSQFTIDWAALDLLDTVFQ